jgi:predicted HicB family RNase H-like nuclease
MQNILKYKDYIAKIEYSIEDEMIIGTVIGTRDAIIFQCDTTDSAEIEKCFHEEIDAYLETCLELGRKPDKSYSGAFNVRISSEAHRKVSIISEKKGVSLNKVVETAIDEYIERNEENALNLFAKTRNLESNPTPNHWTFSISNKNARYMGDMYSKNKLVSGVQ